MGLREYFVNEGAIKLFVAIWMLLNVTVFLTNWFKYQGQNWEYLRKIVGNGLPMARAAANVLNLNCALILVPVCRNLVNFTRGCFECKRSIRRLFDKNITFHKLCAYAIVVGSFLHIGAHIFNVQNIVNSNGAYEPVVKASASWEEVLFTSVPGYTGVAITVAMILIISTASEVIRRSYFELFWITHHFFIVFYGALVFHGYDGFVHRQINYPDLPVQTQKGGPQTWQWVIGPLAIYLAERIYRFYMSQVRPLKILKVVKHFDKEPVLEIQMTKVPTQAGQYIFLHCPRISKVEWHPFTLTSCPELDYISLHIRIAGDWTSSLAEHCGFNCLTFRLRNQTNPRSDDVATMLRRMWHHRRVNVVHVLGDGQIQHSSDVPFEAKDLEQLKNNADVVSESVTDKTPLQAYLLPSVAIDGPFGTCSEDVYHFEAAVLVGAGIGVTPYASILQSLYFRACNPGNYAHSKTKKVYFYWICPGFDAWSWFASLLMDMEQKLAEKGMQDFLSIRVYMTRGWTDADAARIMLNDADDDGNMIVRDDETGRALKHKMNFGRPMWERDFAEFSTTHPGADVGVFFCGPKILSSTLHEECNKATSSPSSRGTRFFYHKENF